MFTFQKVKINLFDYITDLNGKAVHIPFRNRINFLWKIESGSDLAKLSVSGKLTGFYDGNVKVKLLYKRMVVGIILGQFL